MLFPRRLWSGLTDGRITVAFRRWRRPTVRPGGTLKVPGGVLAIDEVAAITPDEVSDEDALGAGATGREEILDDLARRDGTLYRIRFHYLGPDPRRALADRVPDGDELARVLAGLAAMDRSSRRGPWTRAFLEAIERCPEVLAATLAAELGWDRDPFKRNVRRLKELGLTQSCPVGYRLTPRGQAALTSITTADPSPDEEAP